VIGAFVLSRFVSTVNRQRWLGVLATASVAVLIVFGVGPNLGWALALLAIAGATGAYQITVGATVTSWVPDRVRGGAFGVARTGLRVAQGVGVAAGGALAQLIGSAHLAVMVAGLVGLVLALPAALAWRRQYRVDQHDPNNG
jgi:predicted MFS family arabinose efflux permease